MSARRAAPRLALLLLLAAGIAGAVFHRDQIDVATLDARLGSLGAWAPIGHIALYAVATIAFVPGAIFALASWIEADDLKRQFDRAERVTVIDVRNPDEFTGPLGHIRSARNIPVAELASHLAELAGLEGAPIVLVCRTDKRSAAAAQTLRAAGFRQVAVLRRGMEQWSQGGLPVEGRDGKVSVISS